MNIGTLIVTSTVRSYDTESELFAPNITCRFSIHILKYKHTSTHSILPTSLTQYHGDKCVKDNTIPSVVPITVVRTPMIIFLIGSLGEYASFEEM